MDAPSPSASQSIVTVNIDVIERDKENIQPLPSGRSALHLATLSSQTRSGSSEKLAEDHDRFKTRILALETYEADGQSWEEGKLGLTSDEVAAMSKDPLDIHHQYIRFVVDNYIAGPSSSSQLIPLLESVTRKFLNDERYTNTTKYIRLWNLYAKNMECPEDCYRFLFAKGIGTQSSILYEEYALALEAAGK